MTDAVVRARILSIMSEDPWRCPDFSAAMLADAVGIGEPWLQAHARNLGYPHVDALIDSDRARALVKTLCGGQDAPIAVAARACGFPSLARCYDAMVEETGLSPVRFLELLRSRPAAAMELTFLSAGAAATS